MKKLIRDNNFIEKSSGFWGKGSGTQGLPAMQAMDDILDVGFQRQLDIPIAILPENDSLAHEEEHSVFELDGIIYCEHCKAVV